MANQEVTDREYYSLADFITDATEADNTSGWVILQPRFPEALEPLFSVEAVIDWKKFPPEQGRFILDGFYQTRAEAESRLKVLYHQREQKRMTSRSYTPRLRYLVLKRDGFRCQLCGATAKDGIRLEVDHIQPKRAGGDNSMDNLRVLCNVCNQGKAGFSEEEQF